MATKVGVQLLKVDEKEFDASIQDLPLKGLLETIQVLQKEMGREQETFNSLSSELPRLKKNSSQYKAVNRDLARSQTKLTQLMNRSMKCFAQQGNQQAKASVARRNSLKESQRSDVKSRNSDEVDAKPARKIDTSAKNSTAMLQTEETQGPGLSTSHSFSEAMSKFGGKTQNGNHGTTVFVSSSKPVSQNSNAADSAKRLSGNFKDKIEIVDKKEDKVSGKTSVVNVSSSRDGHGKKSGQSSVTSSVSLGPLANQRSQYMSKSVDSVLDNRMSEPVKPVAPDVVKSSNTGKPKSILVMNADKQVIDLDSFTNRKNLLAELKAGKPELKASKVQDNSVKEVALNISTDTNTEPEKPHRPALNANVLGNIRQAKKPSEIKDSATSINKTNGNGAVVENLKQESVQNVRSAVKLESSANKNEQNANRASGGVDKVVEKNKAGTNATKNNLPSAIEVTVAATNVAVSNFKAEQSEDSESESSEASDGDGNFVSEFQFPPSKAVFETPAVKSKGKISFSLFA